MASPHLLRVSYFLCIENLDNSTESLYFSDDSILFPHKHLDRRAGGAFLRGSLMSKQVGFIFLFEYIIIDYGKFSYFDEFNPIRV